jgi:chromate transporter
MLTIPMVVVLIMAGLFAEVSDSAAVQGALRGMGAVAAGMIAATGLKLFEALNENVLRAPISWALSAITFVSIALLRVPLIWVLLGLGGSGALWAYRQLGRLEHPAP